MRFKSYNRHWHLSPSQRRENRRLRPVRVIELTSLSRPGTQHPCRRVRSPLRVPVSPDRRHRWNRQPANLNPLNLSLRSPRVTSLHPLHRPHVRPLQRHRAVGPRPVNLSPGSPLMLIPNRANLRRVHRKAAKDNSLRLPARLLQVHQILQEMRLATVNRGHSQWERRNRLLPNRVAEDQLPDKLQRGGPNPLRVRRRVVVQVRQRRVQASRQRLETQRLPASHAGIHNQGLEEGRRDLLPRHPVHCRLRPIACNALPKHCGKPVPNSSPRVPVPGNHPPRIKGGGLSPLRGVRGLRLRVVRDCPGTQQANLVHPSQMLVSATTGISPD